MTAHAPHASPENRPEFLVDGCPRCEEYLADLGLHFDEDRFRAFWANMVSVEFDDAGGYESALDKALGRRLYYRRALAPARVRPRPADARPSGVGVTIAAVVLFAAVVLAALDRLPRNR